MKTAIRTRTVNVAIFDADDYLGYLEANAWPIVRTKLVDGGRFLQITFAY